MSVNNLTLALNLAAKRKKKLPHKTIEVWRNRRQARKYFIVAVGTGEMPPKSAALIETL